MLRFGSQKKAVDSQSSHFRAIVFTPDPGSNIRKHYLDRILALLKMNFQIGSILCKAPVRFDIDQSDKGYAIEITCPGQMLHLIVEDFLKFLQSIKLDRQSFLKVKTHIANEALEYRQMGSEYLATYELLTLINRSYHSGSESVEAIDKITFENLDNHRRSFVNNHFMQSIITGNFVEERLIEIIRPAN